MTPAEFVRASRTAQGLPALIEDDAAIERAVAIVRPAVAMSLPVPAHGSPTADGPLAGSDIGAAGVVAAVGEVDPTTGRSTSEQDDGPLREQRPVEDCGALSAATGR